MYAGSPGILPIFSYELHDYRLHDLSFYCFCGNLRITANKNLFLRYRIRFRPTCNSRPMAADYRLRCMKKSGVNVANKLQRLQQQSPKILYCFIVVTA